MSVLPCDWTVNQGIQIYNDATASACVRSGTSNWSLNVRLSDEV